MERVSVLIGKPRLVCVQPVKTRLYGLRGATGATLLIINHLRCNIWRNICATGVQHFAPFFAQAVLMSFLASPPSQSLRTAGPGNGVVPGPQGGGFVAKPRTTPPTAVAITPKIAIFILSGDPSAERWIPPKTARNRLQRRNCLDAKDLRRLFNHKEHRITKKQSCFGPCLCAPCALCGKTAVVFVDGQSGQRRRQKC